MSREELLKVAKPILFNTEMVQTILEGRKSVTRRTIKPKYSDSIFEMYKGILCETEPETPPVDLGNGLTALKVRRFVECKKPYKTGDILYVRETWQEVFEVEYIENENGEIENKNIKECISNFDSIEKICTGLSTRWSRPIDPSRNRYIVFKADNLKYSDEKYALRWHPSIHMPKEAARIFFKVTDVRVERLHDMYVDDAIEEGAWGNGIPTLPFSLLYAEHPTASCNAIASFAHIWDSTIKKINLEKHGWNANPWVWVIEFERIAV